MAPAPGASDEAPKSLSAQPEAEQQQQQQQQRMKHGAALSKGKVVVLLCPMWIVFTCFQMMRTATLDSECGHAACWGDELMRSQVTWLDGEFMSS